MNKAGVYLFAGTDLVSLMHIFEFLRLNHLAGLFVKSRVL